MMIKLIFSGVLTHHFLPFPSSSHLTNNPCFQSCTGPTIAQQHGRTSPFAQKRQSDEQDHVSSDFSSSYSLLVTPALEAPDSKFSNAKPYPYPCKSRNTSSAGDHHDENFGIDLKLVSDGGFFVLDNSLPPLLCLILLLFFVFVTRMASFFVGYLVSVLSVFW